MLSPFCEQKIVKRNKKKPVFRVPSLFLLVVLCVVPQPSVERKRATAFWHCACRHITHLWSEGSDDVPSSDFLHDAERHPRGYIRPQHRIYKMLHHLPPRKRLAAQMKEMQQQQAEQRQQQLQPAAAAVITGVRRPREHEIEDSAAVTAAVAATTTTGTVRPPASHAFLGGASKKARLVAGARVVAMIPESDLIREARARAAMAGGEPAVSAAAAEAKATARAKGARAVAARQAAIVKAHAAKAAAKAAEELALLAAKAKRKAEELEHERTQRRAAEAAADNNENKQAKKEHEHQAVAASTAVPHVVVVSGMRPPLPAAKLLSNVTLNPNATGPAGSASPAVKKEKLGKEEEVVEVKECKPLTDEDMARQLHKEMNASPRLGRTKRGDRNQDAPCYPPTSPPPPPPSSEGGGTPRRRAGPSA